MMVEGHETSVFDRSLHLDGGNGHHGISARSKAAEAFDEDLAVQDAV